MSMIPPITQYVVDKKNQKTAVLLPVATYEQWLEDLHDLAIIAQQREDSPDSIFQTASKIKKH